jgi:hypothetical protein
VQVGLAAGILVAAILLPAACAPRRGPRIPAGASPEEPTPEPPPAPTVALRWEEMGPAFYATVTAAPAAGVLLPELRRRHDVHRWSRDEGSWGPPEQPVLVWFDADRRARADSAMAAWFLDRPVGADPAAPGVPMAVPAEPRVLSVLLRDFEGSPVAASPEELVAALGTGWPPPWALCRPAAAGASDLRVAWDAARGLKIGLRELDSKSGGGWTVDHVEFWPATAPVETWWQSKGYGSCEPLASVNENGRWRYEKAGRGP